MNRARCASDLKPGLNKEDRSNIIAFHGEYLNVDMGEIEDATGILANDSKERAPWLLKHIENLKYLIA